jgi:Ca2+-binding RTX toxin-like protein
VNALLAGLTFTPSANYNGSFTVATSVSDGISTVTGSKSFTGIAVNDAPTASNKTLTTNANTAKVFAISDFNFSDVDVGNTLQSVTITALPTAGSLKLNGVAVTASQVITAANISSGLLTFTPAVNASGVNYANIGFKVSDGTALSAAAYTLTMDVTALNNAPTASNRAVSVDEDTTKVFAIADFGFSDVDSGDTLQSVTITALPGGTGLKLNGVAVTASQVITAADISSGLLTFTPEANANGNGYANFGFKVSDGNALSASAYTMTIDVDAVDDLPTATNLNVTEYFYKNVPINFTDIVVTDIDSSEITVEVDIPEQIGTLNTATVGNTTSTYDASNGRWMATGSQADVNSLLAGLTLTPYLDYYPTDIGGYNYLTIGVAVWGDYLNNYFNYITGSKLLYTPGAPIWGTEADDNLTGTSAGEFMIGQGGNDTLTGLEGEDWIFGEEGDDILNGGDGDDYLDGDVGNDVLNGGDGNDTLEGGDGNDTYIVDSTTDTINEYEGYGIDTVQSSVTYTLGATSNLENLTLTGSTAINGTGNSLDNVLIGNSANNTLVGGTGNDTLDGGAGVDTLIGGVGDDTYIIDSTTDTITEYSSGGTDTVKSSVTYTLGAYLENLTLLGTSGLSGYGNSLDNVITGNSGTNTLNGFGGVDTLIGGAGNDVYIVDTATDIIIENVNEGTDLVRSDVSYVLGANIENLVLTSAGGVINGTGNSLSNAITGNNYANILDGGAGNDYLTGGDGNDTYIIDTTGDTIVETATGGIDTVQSSVTYTLGASSNLENLTLTGTAALNGTGNSLTNFLLGNSANNTLTDTAGGNDILQGLGGVDTLNDTSGNNLLDGGIGADVITAGSGNDLIVGGTGNDTITTGNGYDVIVFNKGDGADIINASVGTDNTISLGGNFAYSDLSLTKSSTDLILKVGSTDQITLKGWYNTGANNKSVANLQVIAEAIQGFNLGGSDALRNNKVETFNFANLVAAYDAAGATANWQLTDALLTTHLSSGSDTAAIGGDIAYQYGVNGSLTGVGLLAAQAVINNASVGQTAQTLNAASSWASETIKLS